MIFWMGILIGGLFAWVAVKTGFYQTWAMLFNIVISAYLAICLGPVLIDIIPGVADTPYSNVLAVISAAIGMFLILHCVSYTLLTGQFSVSFPRLFDTLGSVFLGFMAGFFVWSFVTVIICMMPASQSSFVKGLGFGGESQKTNVANVSWWCNLVHKVVRTERDGWTADDAVTKLMEKAQGEAAGEPNEPNEPADVGARNMEPAPLRAVISEASRLHRATHGRISKVDLQRQDG